MTGKSGGARANFASHNVYCCGKTNFHVTYKRENEKHIGVRETNDITFVTLTVVCILLIIILVWLAYRKANGNIVILLRWNRNVVIVESLSSVIIWLVKSSNTGTYFDKDGTTMIMYLNIIMLSIYLVVQLIYRKHQNWYVAKNRLSKKDLYDFDLNKYTLCTTVPHCIPLQSGALLLINIWNVYTFFRNMCLFQA